jgi:hypothetical protein
MRKSALLAALRTELQQHDFSRFVDEPPPIAQGGRGAIVEGCPKCRRSPERRFNSSTILTDDVLG